MAYFTKYGILFTNYWKLADSNHEFSTAFNLLNQPTPHKSYSGILVCLYMWALIIGKPLSDNLIPSSDNGKDFFVTLRSIIGSIIPVDS